jgi:Patatin-like phospholipase
MFSRLLSALRWMYPVRFSLLIAASLPSLVLVTFVWQRRLLLGLFVLSEPWQLFNLTWISLLVAAMALVTWRVTELNAPDRLCDFKNTGTHGPRRWLTWWSCYTGLGMPIPVAAAAATLSDPPQVVRWLGDVQPWQWSATLGALGILTGGWIAGTLLLSAVAGVRQLMLPPDHHDPELLPFERFTWVVRLRNWRLDRLQEQPLVQRSTTRIVPGYTRFIPDPERPEMGHVVTAPGHTQLAVIAGILLACYLGSYVMLGSGHWVPHEHSPVSSLFFGLLALLLVACILPGTAFFFDYYRAPTALVIGIASLLMYQVNQTDHQFIVTYCDEAPAHQTIVEVFQERHRYPGGTMVVVTASGGGIHSAAWTTQVLGGLHARYGEAFSKSVGIASGVSGGGVGLMFYAVHRSDFSGSTTTNSILSPESIVQMQEAAETSALPATGWGIAYPDLLRVFVPVLTHPTVDRGWAIEQAWQHQFPSNASATLSQLEQRVADGAFPVIAWNSTIVESGQRLVFSPVVSPDSRSASQSEDFLRLYPKADLGLATVARMSATFPYVSPIAGPQPNPQAPGLPYYHLADGGYADNDGLVTALEWMDMLIHEFADSSNARTKDRPFDRIVLVRIVPSADPIKPPVAARSGWLNTLLGPLQTMANVRGTSQRERGDLELKWLIETAEQRGIPVVDVPVVFRTSRDPRTDQVPDSPLSWKLTPSQKRVLPLAWQKLLQDTTANSPIVKLDKYFMPQSQQVRSSQPKVTTP